MLLKFHTEIQQLKRKRGVLTVVDSRKGARIAKNGPKVEAVYGPKTRK